MAEGVNEGKRPGGRGEKIVTVAAILLIALALSANELVLGALTCPDGWFEKDDRIRIAVFQGLLLGAGAALFFFRKKRITVNLLLAATVVFVCLAAGEGAVRLFAPQIGGRSQQEVFFEYHPVLGWRFIPGKTDTLVSKHEYENRITINREGLRDRDYPLKKAPGTRRILFLGDSFTAGLGVKDAEVFTEILEEALGPRFEVINAGVNGYGPTQEYLFLKTRLIHYRPDLVIMVFYIGNDFDDTTNLTRWIDGYERPRAIIDNKGALTFTNLPVPRTSRPRGERKKICSLPRSHLVDLLDRVIHERRDRYALDVMPPEIRLCRFGDPSVTEALPLLEAILRETDRLCRQNGGRFALVLAPTMTQVYDSVYWEKIKKVYGLKEDQYDLFLPNRIVFASATRLGIPVLDLTDALRAEAADGRDLYYYKNRHWDPAGHRAVARVLRAWIEEKKMLTEP